MSTITLQSSDNVCFTVKYEILKFSNVLNEMINILGMEPNHEDDQRPILLEHINKFQLEKVIAWCTYHQDTPPIDEALDRISKFEDLPVWDREFLEQFDRETLFSLAAAANFLDIKPMMRLICKAIALQLKGKSVANVLEMFDFLKKTPNSDTEMYLNDIVDGMASLNNLGHCRYPAKRHY